MNTHLLRRIAPGLLVAALAAGCGEGAREVAPSAPVNPAPPAKTAAQGGLKDVNTLPVDVSNKFLVSLPPKSMDAVDHFDQALKAAGWERQDAQTGEQGAWKWFSMPVSKGPKDMFQASWTDPKTHRNANLYLFHTAEEPNVQHGQFEITEANTKAAG